MALGGRDVSAAFDRHQERQDTHLLAVGARGASRTQSASGDRPQLGELDAKGRIAARHLADSLVGVERQSGLFDEELPTTPVTIVPSRLRLERGRWFGDVWLAWKLWQTLGLASWLEERLPRGREDVPWSLMAAVLVIAWLCEPSSELHIAEDWFRRTALDDLLGLPEAKVNDDRLYRALDRLLPHKDALEEHLKERLGTLFKLEYDLLLYDVTSTYFEGQANGNTRAARGYSRDHRLDCKQVCMGLVVSREGFPLGYEVFAGNRRDSTTLQEVVKRMEERSGREGRIWAVDRGMIDATTLQWLKGRGSRYIVGTPKGELKRFEQELLKGTWHEIREGLEVRSVPGGADSETFILCRSADRAAKERARRERFEQRIEKGLQAIVRRCAQQRCNPGVIERRIGRLLGKNARAARLFSVQVGRNESGGVGVTWSRKASALESVQRREGCYLLRSNVSDWAAEDLWKAYMQLTEAEAAFRIQKDELRLRPVWHQTAERVRAHILVCFLAYVLRKTLEGWSQRAGLGRSLPTLLEEFARIQSTDVVLPTTDGRTVRLRCVVRPDKAQTILLHHLGLELPQRLRIPKGVADL
jgi:transposase